MVETDTKSSHATTNLALQAEISSYLATIRSFANCCRVIALLNKTQRHPTELETDAMNDFSYDLVVPAHIRAANAAGGSPEKPAAGLTMAEKAMSKSDALKPKPGGGGGGGGFGSDDDDDDDSGGNPRRNTQRRMSSVAIKDDPMPVMDAAEDARNPKAQWKARWKDSWSWLSAWSTDQRDHHLVFKSHITAKQKRDTQRFGVVTMHPTSLRALLACRVQLEARGGI